MNAPRHFIFLALLLTTMLPGSVAPAAEVAAPPQMPPDEIILFDASPLAQLDLTQPDQLRRYYDETMLLASLQGLLNRERPRLYLRYNPRPDDFWFQRMTEPGAWLAKAKVRRMTSLTDLLRATAAAAHGLAVWDERVPATSNVAATVAGAEDLLVVRHDASPQSLHQQLLREFPSLPVRVSLVGADGAPLFTGQGTIAGTSIPSTGSAKNDAYRWLIHHYVQPGRTNPRLLGFYLDGYWLRAWQATERQNHTLTNIDYVIANRGTLFDLNVWDDEVAVDDPMQPPGSDLQTLKLLLRTCHDRNGTATLTNVIGFLPWCFKYSNATSKQLSAGGKHEPVASEWHYGEIVTNFNGYMEPDALAYSSMANASFFAHYPLPEVIPQAPPLTREQMIAQGLLDADGKLLPVNYYAHYQGDYDCAAWVYWMIPKFWADPARGTLPLSWAINPNLAGRFPFGMHWLRQQAKPGEVFVAGEGAGYIFPHHLQEPRVFSGLPDATEAWRRHSLALYRRWDLSITGFNIDGTTPPMTDAMLAAYATFSPDGLGFQIAPHGQGLFGQMPMLPHSGDLPGFTKLDADGLPEHAPGDAVAAAQVISRLLTSGQPKFLLFRSVLCSPSYYAEIDRQLTQPNRPPVRLVDMRTLFALVREYEQHK